MKLPTHSDLAAGACLALATFPARYVWDYSGEAARAAWAAVAFLVLVVAAVFIGIIIPHERGGSGDRP